MAIEFFPGLSKNFSLLLGGDADDYDVTINVGKGSNAKEFRAHSNILKVRSPYLKNLLSKKGKEDLIINETEISPRVFEMIIGYIYTGLLDLDSQSDPDIFELILASHRLFLEELITYVPKYLVEKRYEWIEQNFEMVLHEAFRLKGCRKLQDYCLDYICEEPKPFFKSESQNLEKTVLLGLLKRDHLRVKEIDIWNYLIKWGIAHSSELKGKDIINLNNWDKKDFIALKKTLNQFISNIRFFVISSADFDEKVQPFAEVLPKKLYQEILSYHKDNIQPSPDTFLPPRQGKVFVDSKIINRRHAAILANWIQRNDPYDRIPINVRYNLDLIYHGSRDGYDIDTVRTKCHTQGSCILVMKIEEKDAIIGGYNPIGWNHINTNYSSEHTFSWIDTNESFIFSLDGKDLNNIKISRVVDSTKALYESNFYNYKLNFGNSDLIINVSDNFGTCNQSNYESSILVPNIFFIKEIEIFKIVKREILQDDL